MPINPSKAKPNFVNPEQILSQLEITEDDIIADLGCGSGFVAFEASKLIGENGLIYAVDIQKAVLSAIQSKVKLNGARNVKTVWADLEVPGSTKIENDSVDLTILAAILYQTKEHEKVLQEAARITKPSGKILIIDWEKTNIPLGPDVKLRVLKDDVRKKAEAANLKFVKEIEVDKYHYGLIFEK